MLSEYVFTRSTSLYTPSYFSTGFMDSYRQRNRRPQLHRTCRTPAWGSRATSGGCRRRASGDISAMWAARMVHGRGWISSLGILISDKADSEYRSRIMRTWYLEFPNLLHIQSPRKTLDGSQCIYVVTNATDVRKQSEDITKYDVVELGHGKPSSIFENLADPQDAT